MVMIRESYCGVKVGDITKKGIEAIGPFFRLPGTTPRNPLWMCVTKCVACGEVSVRFASNLGNKAGCNCHRVAPNKTHGMTQSPLFVAWQNMRKRCYNPKSQRYKTYGARGITVCDEWNNSSTTFLKWATENGWKPGLEIDRIDLNGNYCPENCRFIPHAEQARNRTTTRRLTAWGETKGLQDWLEDPRCVVIEQTIHQRLKKGWSHEAAIGTPSTPPALRRSLKIPV